MKRNIITPLWFVNIFYKKQTPSGIGKAFKRLGFVQTFFDGIGNLICRNPEKPEQFIGRTGSAETVHSDYGTPVSPTYFSQPNLAAASTAIRGASPRIFS